MMRTQTRRLLYAALLATVMSPCLVGAAAEPAAAAMRAITPEKGALTTAMVQAIEKAASSIAR